MRRMGPLEHAAAVLQSFDIEPKPLDRLLEKYFRRHRELSSAPRRLIAEAVFGVARWRRRLDGWLRLQGMQKPRHADRALCYLLWKRPEEARMVPLEELSRAAGIAGPFGEGMPKGFPGGEPAFFSLPDFLYALLAKAHGGEGARDLAARLGEPSVPVLRINTLRANVDEARRILSDEDIDAAPTQRSPYGLRLFRRAPIEASRAYRSGAVEIQDESSQLAVIAADPKPGEAVLDACAGAGGKSLMMAMLMGNEGRIVASDASAPRLGELARRARRAGARTIESVPASALTKRCDRLGRFDLVFIDAPCSGTGTLRRNPDLKWRLSPAAIEEGLAVQDGLLEEYSRWVRPGGRLVYATCSILPRENEEVVGRFLHGGGFSLQDAAAPLRRRGISPDRIVTDEGYLKMDPRDGEWDGFFTAILVKR